MANEGTGTGKAAAQGQEAEAQAQKSPLADAIALLKADHRQVEQLFRKFTSAEDNEKAGLVAQICKALTIHTMVEEEIFYPACREKAADEDPLDEAQVEHDSAKVLIADLERGGPGDAYYDAKVSVLAEQIRHHVAEEEKGRTGIFARAQQGGVNTPELGAKVQQRKSELEAWDEVPAGRPVAIAGFPQAQGAQSKESEMVSNQQTRERDDRGRFVSDDDDRRGRNQYSRGRDDDDRSYSSRGSNDRNRDEEGRFTSSGNGRRSSRDDDDDYRSSRGGRNEGRGWYGDSQGHSEAAQRGWDDRGGGRSSRDYDDDRTYRSRSFGRYDDDDRDSRGRGRSGWYGDPEGHSEAARRGWDDRGSSRSSRGGRDDDDDRRGRNQYSRGRDDDDRDRGQGGWFGDPRGHSEAARRGWEDRR